MTRGGLLVIGVCFASGCLQPVVEVRIDGGGGGSSSEVIEPSDAGFADGDDAGAIDAGPSDSGVVDAGGTDAGLADAGAPDAGVLGDAGVVDSGLPDSGPLDSGVDAGELDAGPRDAGGPEECNGSDDDGDGRVDVLPDGGALVRACPLSLGVCVGRVSVCVDGGYVACDYGNDYQVTEDRCDGVDNDCDGRVDHSWSRALWSSDAGVRFGPYSQFPYTAEIDYGEVFPQQIFIDGDDFIYSATGHFARVERSLRVRSDLVTPGYSVFPLEPPLAAFSSISTFRRGDAWFRFLWSNANAVRGRGFAMYVLEPDGGVPLEPDGGLHVLWSYLAPYSWHLTAPTVTPRDAGFDVFSFNRDWGFFAHVEVDGGASILTRTPDGGLAQNWQFSTASGPFGSGFVAAAGSWSPGSSVLDDLLIYCDERLDCAPMLRGSASWCSIPRWSPMTVACTTDDHTDWFNADGGVVFASDAGVMSANYAGWRGPTSDRLFASLSGSDGGASIAVVTPGLMLPFAERPSTEFQLHQLDGGLHLLVWGEGRVGVCPACEFERVNAEYVCVP